MNLTFLAAVGAGMAGSPTAGLVALQSATGGDLVGERSTRHRRARRLPRARRTPVTAPVPLPLPTAGLNRVARDNATTPVAVTTATSAGSR